MINKEERIVVRRFFTFGGVASPALGQIDIRTINRYLRHLGSIVYRYAKSGYFAEPGVMIKILGFVRSSRGVFSEVSML